MQVPKKNPQVKVEPLFEEDKERDTMLVGLKVSNDNDFDVIKDERGPSEIEDNYRISRPNMHTSNDRESNISRITVLNQRKVRHRQKSNAQKYTDSGIWGANVRGTLHTQMHMKSTIEIDEDTRDELDRAE